jgi:hypothetical protein
MAIKTAGQAMPITSSSIIAALPNLTKKELMSIQVVIEHELLKGSPIDKDLFSLVFEVVNEKPVSVSRFSSSQSGIIWRKNQPVFDAFICKLTDNLHNMHNKVRMLALKRLLIELLIEDIKTRFIPLSARTVSQELGNIEAVFDRGYPGYLRNGLGHLILKQLGV